MIGDIDSQVGALASLLLPLEVTIPSTAGSYTPMARETEEQRQARRDREAGLTADTCPKCGGRATREVVTVSRPGRGTVRRTLLRCWRKPKYAHDRCPVQTLSEETVGGEETFAALERMLAEAARQKEETMSETRTKPCLDCGTTIEDSHGRKRCPECNRKFETERKRLAWRRTYNEKHGLPVPEEAQRLRDARGGRPAQPKPVPVQTAPAPARPVPVPVPVPVDVDDETDVDFAGLLIDVLGLSLSRRNLLRALLEEVQP